MTLSDLRECQRQAIRIINERRSSEESETNISKCTGSGKSRVIREISQEKERRILVFPWLDLLTQYYDDHKDAYSSHPCIRYFATEGTLKDIQRLSSEMNELDEKSYVIFTTYTSAPLIYAKINQTRSIDLTVHDEAHRIERPEYAASFSKIASLVNHTVNLSATLPSSKEAHYKYSLLRGIKDGVVRDFHMELFLCVDKERSETKLVETIVEKLHNIHSEVKLLIYTAEANTEGETASSVKTFLEAHAKKLGEKGWWIEGIKDDTKDRKKLLREFEKHRDVSILVSCRTLSEGIDLKNANCMLPWDPSASVVNNIQRIGRVLRLYKTSKGEIAKNQSPSTVLIPVFLNEGTYKECDGDKEKINEVLCKEISEGERGNFRPIVNVCTALKSELADEDPDLFNRLLDYPYEPKVEVNMDLVDCVAKHCKKSSETVLEEIATALEGKVEEEQLDELREGEWDEEINGQVVEALVDTQGITLVVKDGEEVDLFGKGETVVTVEKKDEGYKVVKDKKEAGADKEAAQKRVAQRMRINFSDDCTILLGLESIEGAENTGGMVLARLTTEVHLDKDWEKRRLEWVAVYEKLGRSPRINKQDKNETRASQWQQQQRHYYKNNVKALTKERIISLNSTEGWKWEEEDTWEPSRQHWISQYVKLGKPPSCSSKDLEEKQAGRWQVTQRKAFRKKEIYMTPERLALLEATPGWVWDKYGDKWRSNLEKWVIQYNLLNSPPSQSSDRKDEKMAAQWQQNQRQNYKRKDRCMTDERISILEATRGWKWEESDEWEINRQQWICQYNKLQRSPSGHSTDLEEKRAGRWQYTQRGNYRMKATSMTPERILILDVTPGWKWNEDDNWELQRQRWLSYYQKLGRSPNAESKNEDEKQAGNWQGVQRRNYRKKMYITPEKISILEKTPGWRWEEEDTWETKRQEWIHQYEKLGRQPSYASKDPKEKKAGAWQTTQRSNYKNKKECLTPHRIQMLESISGWKWEEEDVWEPNRLNWIKQFQKLGRFPNRKSENEDEKRAGAWQSIQRQDYQNKEKCMTTERITILEETSGWKWKDDDTWEPSRQQWIAQFQKLGRLPSQHTTDNEEKQAANWQTVQRRNYKNKEKCLTSERIAILEGTSGWKWKESDLWEIWTQNLNNWKFMVQKKNGALPTRVSNDILEKKAHTWQNNQRQDFRNKKSKLTKEHIQILESTPGWTWSSDEEPKTPTTTLQPRTRKPVKAKAESTGSGQQRQRSELEEFHKRFKTMNASTYKSSITAEDFTAYHAIADTYDAKDPVERQPVNKIAALLSKYNKPSYSAIDLGCGKNCLRVQESVSKMKWTSVDVHTVDDSVIQADMAALPFEDESYDFAVLGRSLWARNHLDVMKETLRVLKSGGRSIICESFQRWMKGSENELLRDLKATGFEIVYEEGTKIEDSVEDVFQYVVVRKP
jgi:superfamily II DNA or RNA helicase